MNFLVHRIVFVFLIAVPLLSFSQDNFTISGSVKDASSGEELISATIAVKELPGVGVVANDYGFYSLTLKKGTYTIRYQYLGYQTQEVPVELSASRTINIELKPTGRELKEVEITADRPDLNVTRVQMGVERLTSKEIKQIPVLFGEQDVLKTLSLLPGVKSAGEGNAGFYVRGGSADQNLILLDEAPVYNASHLLGFFSVFNSDAIKDVTLYKGTMPAEFGGRVSSVLDVKMNDGNSKRRQIRGGIGLIASRLTFETPLLKDRSSLIVSGRRTYADVFLKLSRDSNLRKSHLYFYDFNAKLNYRINDKNRVFLSGYFGRDDFGFGETFAFDWGNATGTVRWNHLFSDKLFSNTSLIFSNYDYRISLNTGEFDIDISSSIRDWNIKQDYQYFASSKSSFKFGWNAIYHTFVPGKIQSTGAIDLNNFLKNRYALENAVYGTHEWKISSLLNAEYGLRVSSFSFIGNGPVYSFLPDGAVDSTYQVKKGTFVKTYFNLEPRLNLAYLIDEKQSVKAGYARTTQNLHLLSNTTSGNPTDIWVPSSNNIRPELCDQFSAGYFRNLMNNAYETSFETYYKNLYNQIDYRNGAVLIFNELVEGELVYGSGRAYGAEFLVRKKVGKLTGWVGYTLSRTERKFNDINEGNYYPAKQDRTHDVVVVAIYELNKKWSLSSNFIYYTGNAVTFPSGKYQIDGQVVNYYSERNGYRMPAYHRLDFGATYFRKNTDTYESSWTFSVYNVYGRKNAYTISFRESETNPGTTEAVRLSLFRAIPAITYNFHFK